MSYLSEFTDYDADLYISEGFVDDSYHNDIMPKVTKTIKTEVNEIKIHIWQDYIDKDLREYDDKKRFFFSIVCNSNLIFDYETDDLDEVKKLVNAICK